MDPSEPSKPTRADHTDLMASAVAVDPGPCTLIIAKVQGQVKVAGGAHLGITWLTIIPSVPMIPWIVYLPVQGWCQQACMVLCALRRSCFVS